VRVDHVIYAAADLDAAAARVERELGLAARAGGRHEGLGTHNRIVPLGPGYLELVAVADPEEAAGSDFGRGVMTRLARGGDGLLGWVVAVTDVAEVARRLGTAITTIRREGLSARLTGLSEAMREPFLPFFISRRSWSSGSGHRRRRRRHHIDRARRRRRPSAAVAQITRLPVRVRDGAPAVLAVGIGERELRD
jgi:hypothetical protein